MKLASHRQPAAAQPLEMTLQEARDRVALAYGLLEKARSQTESLQRLDAALTDRITGASNVCSLYATLDLVSEEGSADYLADIYRPHQIYGARARLGEALDRDGIPKTLAVLRNEPERFGELLGATGSLARASAFEDAERLGRDLERLLLEQTPRRRSVTDDVLRPRDLDLSAARALPERIAQLIAHRDHADDLLIAAVTREDSAERHLADAARLTGGTYFARNQLGYQEGLAVARVLHRLQEPEGLVPTRFSRYQGKLQEIDWVADRISKVLDSRWKLQARASDLASRFRREKELIERRSGSLGALARDRAAFRSHLAEAYRTTSLPKAREALARHTEHRGRVATAAQLKQEPSRFGRLHGLPGSQARREAKRAAKAAAHRLRTFETHRHDLSKLPGRRSVRHLRRLEGELALVRHQLSRVPSLRGHQLDLIRAVEAAGGPARVSAYLSITTAHYLGQALQAVRSIEGGHER